MVSNRINQTRTTSRHPPPMMRRSTARAHCHGATAAYCTKKKEYVVFFLHEFVVHLRCVTFSRNSYTFTITAVPASIGSLTALTALSLGDNRIATLPDWIGAMTALTTLSLGDNQLAGLPDAMGSVN